MDSARFRRRLVEIQAELAEMDPRVPGTAERAADLREEIAALAAEQRQRSSMLAARAFGGLVTPTGVDAPVETIDAFVESVASDYPSPQTPASSEASR